MVLLDRVVVALEGKVIGLTEAQVEQRVGHLRRGVTRLWKPLASVPAYSPSEPDFHLDKPVVTRCGKEKDGCWLHVPLRLSPSRHSRMEQRGRDLSPNPHDSVRLGCVSYHGDQSRRAISPHHFDGNCFSPDALVCNLPGWGLSETFLLDRQLRWLREVVPGAASQALNLVLRNLDSTQWWPNLVIHEIEVAVDMTDLPGLPEALRFAANRHYEVLWNNSPRSKAKDKFLIHAAARRTSKRIKITKPRKITKRVAKSVPFLRLLRKNPDGLPPGAVIREEESWGPKALQPVAKSLEPAGILRGPAAYAEDLDAAIREADPRYRWAQGLQPLSPNFPTPEERVEPSWRDPGRPLRLLVPHRELRHYQPREAVLADLRARAVETWPSNVPFDADAADSLRDQIAREFANAPWTMPSLDPLVYELVRQTLHRNNAKLDYAKSHGKLPNDPRDPRGTPPATTPIASPAASGAPLPSSRTATPPPTIKSFVLALQGPGAPDQLRWLVKNRRLTSTLLGGGPSACKRLLELERRNVVEKVSVRGVRVLRQHRTTTVDLFAGDSDLMEIAARLHMPIRVGKTERAPTTLEIDGALREFTSPVAWPLTASTLKIARNVRHDGRFLGRSQRPHRGSKPLFDLLNSDQPPP
ncbi:MAG: hypothetical protein JKY65_27525 [Planctomycetes bacterium]|nr:hypothetical protein [Planctomycetota bacterium]